MSSSNIKYPSGGGGSTPFATTIPVLVINEYHGSVQINSVTLLNGVDDPAVILTPGTGYQVYPIPGATGGVTRYFAKGTVDISVVPAMVRINFDAAIPTSFGVTVFCYGTGVSTGVGSYGSSGTYDLDVPVFILPGDILVIHFGI